ncbi:MAG: hypothetical protein ACR2F6_01895 [Mycobacteriales bacterium]
MSGIFGVRGPRKDPEREAAARRTQEKYLKDLGDQEGLDRLAVEPRRRRRLPGWILAVVLVVLVITGYKAFTGTNHVQIDKSCTSAGIRIASAKANPGASVPWSATGPSGSEWALVVGSGKVTRSGDNVSVAGGTGGPVFPLKGCLAHGGLLAPETSGEYVVQLLKMTGGTAQRRATTRLRVLG